MPQTSLTLSPPAAVEGAGDWQSGGRGAQGQTGARGGRSPSHPAMGMGTWAQRSGVTCGKETNCVLNTPSPLLPKGGNGGKGGQVGGTLGSPEAESGPRPLSPGGPGGWPELSFQAEGEGVPGGQAPFSPGWVPFPGSLSRGVKAWELASDRSMLWIRPPHTFPSSLPLNVVPLSPGLASCPQRCSQSLPRSSWLEDRERRWSPTLVPSALGPSSAQDSQWGLAGSLPPHLPSPFPSILVVFGW